MLDALLRWLRPGRDRDNAADSATQPFALEAPGTWTLDRDGEFVADVTICSTEQLVDRNGRIPEETAAVYAATALDGAGLGYRIRIGFDPVALDTQHAQCRDEAEQPDAKDHYEPIVADWNESGRDANLILTDAAGGGCAQWWDPRCAAVGARALRERREWTPEGSDDFHAQIQAVLHELGHCLGASHDHDREREGRQHPGMGWNDHEREVWRYTPTVFGNGVENRCGEWVPEREYETDVRVHEFHDCAIEVFERELRERVEE